MFTCPVHLSEIKSWVTSRYFWTWNEGWCMFEWDFPVLKCGKSRERNSNCLTLRIHPLAPVQWLDFDFFLGPCPIFWEYDVLCKARCSKALGPAAQQKPLQSTRPSAPCWSSQAENNCPVLALNWHICDWRQPLTLGSQVPYRSLYLGVSSLTYELPLDYIANFLWELSFTFAAFVDFSFGRLDSGHFNSRCKSDVKVNGLIFRLNVRSASLCTPREWRCLVRYHDSVTFWRKWQNALHVLQPSHSTWQINCKPRDELGSSNIVSHKLEGPHFLSRAIGKRHSVKKCIETHC